MYITNITTNDCDSITDLKTTNEYNNCTDNENNIEISLPTILLTIPCGFSFLSLLSLMQYILSKPLLKFNLYNRTNTIFYSNIKEEK